MECYTRKTRCQHVILIIIVRICSVLLFALSFRLFIVAIVTRIRRYNFGDNNNNMVKRISPLFVVKTETTVNISNYGIINLSERSFKLLSSNLKSTLTNRIHSIRVRFDFKRRERERETYYTRIWNISFIVERVYRIKNIKTPDAINTRRTDKR